MSMSTTLVLSRLFNTLTLLSLMDACFKFNSLETDPRVIVLNSSVEIPPPLSSVATLDSALTSRWLNASLNRSDPLLKSELLRLKMAVLRDSATLNSRMLKTLREPSISSTVKTSMDVTSDLTSQPTAVAVEAEEAVVAVSEVVDAVASVVVTVEVIDSEAATGTATEEAVAASEVAIAVATAETETTDPHTEVTVTVTEEMVAASEVIAEIVTAVTIVIDATVVAPAMVETAIDVEVAIEEVVEVSNGIE